MQILSKLFLMADLLPALPPGSVAREPVQAQMSGADCPSLDMLPNIRLKSAGGSMVLQMGPRWRAIPVPEQVYPEDDEPKWCFLEGNTTLVRGFALRLLENRLVLLLLCAWRELADHELLQQAAGLALGSADGEVREYEVCAAV